MGINLPGARNVFLPSLPPSLSSVSGVVEYLENLKSALEKEFSKGFENVYTILSTGTSGSFVDSLGATVTVVNGIITGLA